MFDEKSLKILEFPKVREILATYTSFSLARELALALNPLDDDEAIKRRLGESQEARRLISLEPGFSIGEVHDIREPTHLAAKGKMLDPQSLVKIQKTLGSCRNLQSRLLRESKEYPLLWDIARELTPHPRLEAEISRCITPTGEILDTASEKLLTIKLRVRETRQSLMKCLDAIIHSPDMGRVLQEGLITERAGRFVIPVKAESRREVRGIIHDVSNTGQTVFLEPLETIEFGNELRELAVTERQEIERILSELSASVGSNEFEISRNVELLAALELALAKARYAERVKAQPPVIYRPEEGDKKPLARAGVLRINEARHPLLWDRAVPISIEIGKDFSILVITGPNTGGKTVTLKTIGLLTLMAQSGIPIPAGEGSTIPTFDGIFADIGDEQSIEQMLSSFSWHMGNIVGIIKKATSRSLVLLDELGTSTDPAEGAALARAILLYFLSRGAITVATTHFNELKAFAHTTPGLQNASLDFDPVTFTPTYHLTIGTPGGSNALKVAEKLGLPPEIIASARGMLAKSVSELETLISSLMAQKQKNAALSSELEKEKGEVAAERERYALKLKELADEETRLIREVRDRLALKSAELQKEIRRIGNELKKAREPQALERAKKSLAGVKRGLTEEDWLAQARYQRAREETAEPYRIVPGDTVWVRDTGLQGVVSTISPKGQLEIQTGNTTFRVRAEKARKINSVPHPPSGEVSFIRTEPAGRVGLELDLRGRRANAVNPELDRYLNEASLAGLPQVRIIHGSATGTVRQIVRQILPTHPLVKSFRPGGPAEGGDGVTIIQLQLVFP